MQLRYTKGVGIALAIAAGCAVLGFVMAPGWWFFGIVALWSSVLLAAGGVVGPVREKSNGHHYISSTFVDTVTDPAYRAIDPTNIHREPF